MKKSIIIYYLFFTVLAFSQQEEREKGVKYTNINSLEVFTNRTSRLSNEEFRKNKGFGIEINSLHGFFFLRKLSFSIGVGLAINVKENFKAIPIIGDLKWYLYDYGVNSPYVLLNAGRNLKFSSFVSGFSSKLGLGVSLEDENKFDYIIEFFIKSKEYQNRFTKKNYQVEGLGLSFGLKF